MSSQIGNRRAAGRGRKYPRVLRTCVSDGQLEKIRDEAERAGMSVCKYLRERATGGHVSGMLDTKVLHELTNIGRNLHQMWKEGHETRAAIDAVKSAAAALERHI